MIPNLSIQKCRLFYNQGSVGKFQKIRKKTGKTIGPPPPPPSTAPTSTRPIQFDFKFSGDASPPTIEK